MLDKRINSHIR